ncbi:hypothetical protein TNCV_3957961 [Trichonephila clavipes]|nr:hypothetical protein TNCV_3957961 [Trichonephila clavipes]
MEDRRQKEPDTAQQLSTLTVHLFESRSSVAPLTAQNLVDEVVSLPKEILNTNGFVGSSMVLEYSSWEAFWRAQLPVSVIVILGGGSFPMCVCSEVQFCG